ncbi:MAG: hypothetical protein AAGH76_15620 [Pseudomonadota bacterium]
MTVSAAVPDHWLRPSSALAWSEHAPLTADRRLLLTIAILAVAAHFGLSFAQQRFPAAAADRQGALVLNVVGPIEIEAVPPEEVEAVEETLPAELVDDDQTDGPTDSSDASLEHQEISATEQRVGARAAKEAIDDANQKTNDAPTDVVPGAEVDWLALIPDGVAAALATPPADYEQFDGRPAGLEAAKIKYAPGPPAKPAIWDNVETDQLGRKILRSGRCYRVIEDDNPLRLDIFENFTQYFVFCENEPKRGKELPWVQELREKRGWDEQRDDGEPQ